MEALLKLAATLLACLPLLGAVQPAWAGDASSGREWYEEPDGASRDRTPEWFEEDPGGLQDRRPEWFGEDEAPSAKTGRRSAAMPEAVIPARSAGAEPEQAHGRQVRDEDDDASFWQVHYALDAQSRRIQRGAGSWAGRPAKKKLNRGRKEHLDRKDTRSASSAGMRRGSGPASHAGSRRPAQPASRHPSPPPPAPRARR